MDVNAEETIVNLFGFRWGRRRRRFRVGKEEGRGKGEGKRVKGGMERNIGKSLTGNEFLYS